MQSTVYYFSNLLALQYSNKKIRFNKKESFEQKSVEQFQFESQIITETRENFQVLLFNLIGNVNGVQYIKRILSTPFSKNG